MQKDLAGSPRAAVIIPHFNDHVRLTRCLDALHENDLSDVEVVVVDNGSVPPLSEHGRAFSGVRFLSETVKGAASARNRGVRETSARMLLFLDADCVPSKDWVATAMQLLPEDRLVGGRIDVFDESAPPRTGAEAFEAVMAFNQKLYVEKKGFSATANLVTTRRVFEETGDFRAGVSEDLDWCQRAVARGFDLTYADALVVAHPSRASWQALEKKWKRLTEETWALHRRGDFARARWLARALLMLPSALFHMPHVLLSSKLESPRERVLGLLTLVRIRSARAMWMLRQALT